MLKQLDTTETDQAVDLYHRYMAARHQFLTLEMQLQEKLRNPNVNLTEYWKRLNDERP